MGHVPGELAASEHRQDLRRLARLVQDLDLAGLDDEELEVALADLDELVSGPIALQRRAGAAAQRGHLGVAESGRGHGVQVALGHESPPTRREGDAVEGGLGRHRRTGPRESVCWTAAHSAELFLASRARRWTRARREPPALAVRRGP